MTSQHQNSAHGRRLESRREPFPRSHRRPRDSGWEAVELGGHEVVSTLYMEMRPGPEAAGEGRHTLDRLEGAIDTAELDVLKLLVTELITNSVRHGDSPEWIELDLELYANAVRVEVRDRGRGFEPSESPTPHTDRTGGWGLCLVDRLADRWGVAVDDATRVWFEVDRRRRRFATA